MQVANADKLLALITEYGQLKSDVKITPQARGQALNGLIARMLLCWGLDAEPNIRRREGKGEIDVAVNINSRHFVIEAKWEKKKTDFKTVALLKNRVSQRVVGTCGLVISIAGFTSELIRDAAAGGLNVILMDKNHLEAMLSGFVPPQEMIEQLVKKASQDGIHYSALHNLYPRPFFSQMNPSFGNTISFSHPTDNTATHQLKTCMSDLPFGQFGIVAKSNDEIILTTTEGLFLADLENKNIKPLLNFPDCSGNTLIDKNGAIYIRRNSGIGKLENGKLTCIGGAIIGGSNLMEHPDGSLRVFSMNRHAAPDEGARTFIATFGNELGTQSTAYTNEAPHQFISTCYTADGNLILVGHAGIALLAEDTRTVLLDFKDSPLCNTNGIFRISDYEFYICSNNTTIWKFNSKTNSLIPAKKYPLMGGCFTICDSLQNGGYLWGNYRNEAQEQKCCVLKWSSEQTVS